MKTVIFFLAVLHEFCIAEAKHLNVVAWNIVICLPTSQFGMQHFIQNCIQNVNIAIALNSFHCDEVILGEQS